MAKNKFQLKDLIYISLFAALMAIGAWISVPGVVPFTLQTFVVFATAGLLGWKRGTIAVLVYILLGAIGIPVFSGFRGGIGALTGATGGYIVGFLISVFVTGLICDKLGHGFIVSFVAMVIGLVLCYAFGTAWFVILYTKTKGAMTVAGALSACVVPFIIPDLVKILVATIVVNRLSKHITL